MEIAERYWKYLTLRRRARSGGQWPAFGYIAAEAELKRQTESDKNR